jgi:hypothetical protein
LKKSEYQLDPNFFGALDAVFKFGHGGPHHPPLFYNNLYTFFGVPAAPAPMGGSALKGRRSRRLTAATISTIANVSGTVREKSRSTLFRFCTKKNYALCGFNGQQRRVATGFALAGDFAAPGGRKAFPLGGTMSVIGSNPEVSALREFFTV